MQTSPDTPATHPIILHADLHAEDERAPRVIASGKGSTAEAILAAAAEHGIPVEEDEALLGLLAECEVGEEIPPELYEAVAELLRGKTSALYGASGVGKSSLCLALGKPCVLHTLINKR